MNTNNKIHSKKIEHHQKREDWFNNLIDNIKMDKFLLDEEIASNETKKTYDILMRENPDEIFDMTLKASSRHFISRIIFDYVKEIKLKNVNFTKLAFDLGNSKVLAWAEISNDDEESEDRLIMAEAKINAIYNDFGFNLTSTIVEVRDELTIPNHYHSIS